LWQDIEILTRAIYREQAATSPILAAGVLAVVSVASVLLAHRRLRDAASLEGS
jgi:hypothetical protein